MKEWQSLVNKYKNIILVLKENTPSTVMMNYIVYYIYLHLDSVIVYGNGEFA